MAHSAPLVALRSATYSRYTRPKITVPRGDAQKAGLITSQKN